MVKASLIGAGVTVALTGCGGSSSSSNPEDESEVTQAGRFVDSPVVNVGYRTETQSGDTNGSGEFQYLNGETVIFSIGDLDFPPAPATGIVTPLDMVESDNVNDPTVVNIIRLLQTLDQDGDLDNGIQIAETARNSATQIDFSLTREEFESSPAVTTLVGNSGSVNVSLISAEDAIAHFQSTLDQNFTINLSGTTVSSVITFSECPTVPGGWDYSFTDTTMTLSGSDGWETSPCTLNERETFSLNVPALADDFDVPFNCSEFPVCTVSDFEKTLSGLDDDDREFTSTYSFNRASETLTFIKSVEGTTFTEVILLDQSFNIDMTGRTASSVVTFSECSGVPGGWDYSFTGTAMTLSGSDGWQTPSCALNDSEEFSLTVPELGSEFDIPFNCVDYPVCTISDFEKVLAGKDEDNRDFTSTYFFDPSSLTLTYQKAVEGTTFSEVITIK